MNDNAKKWVEALRSGEFQQTTRKLSDGNGYCCLGVACEVYRRETGDGEWEQRGDTELPVLTFLGVWNVLPDPVRRWLGLSEESGDWKDENGEWRYLTNTNDHGATFAEIADIVESEPDQLFVKEEA